MAYAQLLSLTHVLQRTLKYDCSYLLPGEKQQIDSVLEKVVYLQDFLDNFPRENIESIEGLERKISDAACQTEDSIESCIADRVPEDSESHSEDSGSHSGVILSTSRIAQLFEEVDSTKTRAEKIEDESDIQEELERNTSLPDGSLRPVSPGQSTMVGLHDASVEILDRLVSGSSKLESCIADRVLEDSESHSEDSGSHSGVTFTTSFHEIAKLIEEVDSMKARAKEIEDGSGMQEDLERNTSLPAGSLRPDSWGQSTMVGLDDAFSEIKHRLVSSSSHLEVVSIVGMGGIGKTTLAQKVYTDKYIEYHFDICAWFTVSQEYKVREILLGLLDSMKIKIDGMSGKDIDQLGESLYKNLKGRRYLFVMDDVWDPEAWDSLKRYFPDDEAGSRILLTTRVENVANYIGSGSPLHRVRFLNLKESWKLFCLKVFGEGFCPLELEEIGKKIAQNCRGLPLAVAVIGGLLSKATKTPHYWRSIAKNLSSEITSNDEQCSKILSLSYKHLPYHLKGCFLYMGIFPEDFEINARVLTRLWVAEGILKPASSKTLEDVGEEYFLDLVQRSLILVQRKSSNSKIKTCRIHDLLRGLCVREAEKERFFLVIKNRDHLIYEGTRMRRASIHVEKNFLSFSDKVEFYYATNGSGTEPPPRFGARFGKRFRIIVSRPLKVRLNSRRLKVLHTEGIHPDCLEMELLVKLRYIYCFPQISTASIYKLRNLQTIVSLDDYGSIELPPEMWTMPQLRHVMLNASVHLPDPPISEIKGEENSIVVLENLQTLSRIYNFRLTKEVLERIPNLLKLAVHYDSIEVANWEEYCINNLVHLTKLESLKCWLTYMFPCFLAHITFPTSLKKLILEGAELLPKDYLKLHQEELTILGKVPNLEVLKLKNFAFDGLEWEPNEGEFLKLKFLLLDDIYLKHWRADSIHFPSLERLVISIKACRELDEIPSGFGDISTLQSIELRGCGDSIVESAKKIEEAQLDWGNDAFKLYIEEH